MVHALFPSDFDHARIPQFADVMIDRLRRQVQFARNLAHGHLLRPQEVDDSSSGLVSEELKCIWIFDELECLHGPRDNVCLWRFIIVSIMKAIVLLTSVAITQTCSTTREMDALESVAGPPTRLPLASLHDVSGPRSARSLPLGGG